MIKVLVVEDNNLNREMLTKRLSKRGFEVRESENGKDAIDILPSFMPDIIILDMKMPVMDGIEAVSFLKADDRYKGIPVIGLSANAMSGDIDEALKAGCDDYETKPVDFKKLIEKISNWCGQKTA